MSCEQATKETAVKEIYDRWMESFKMEPNQLGHTFTDIFNELFYLEVNLYMADVYIFRESITNSLFSKNFGVSNIHRCPIKLD